MTAPIVTQSTVSSAPPYAAGYGDLTARPATPTSGLSEEEARGFNTAFFASFLGFLAIAIVAHFLVWQWRPWIPGARGYPVRGAQATSALKPPPTLPAGVQLASTSHR